MSTSDRRTALRSLTVALVALAGCGSDARPGSGLDEDAAASSLTAPQKAALCAYEEELRQTDGCGGQSGPPPSDLCQDSSLFSDDMACGYTVDEVETCMEERFADPCDPINPASCAYVEACECIDPEACLG